MNDPFARSLEISSFDKEIRRLFRTIFTKEKNDRSFDITSRISLSWPSRTTFGHWKWHGDDACQFSASWLNIDRWWFRLKSKSSFSVILSFNIALVKRRARTKRKIHHLSLWTSSHLISVFIFIFGIREESRFGAEGRNDAICERIENTTRTENVMIIQIGEEHDE